MAANAESTTSELLAIEAGRDSSPDAARLLMDADDRTIVDVLRSLNPAIAQDILDDIPDERRALVLAAASPAVRFQWLRNDKYDEDTIGRFMETPRQSSLRKRPSARRSTKCASLSRPRS